MIGMADQCELKDGGNMGVVGTWGWWEHEVVETWGSFAGSVRARARVCVCV